MHQPAYLRRTAAAAYLMGRYGAYTAKTLAKLATVGGGPPYRKFGPYPLYAQDDLDAWASSRMSNVVRSSAELA
jgi:hypothetical protein